MIENERHTQSVQIIGYADDIAVTIVAKELHQIEATCVTTLARIKSWLKSANLQLAGQKTEGILVTSRKKIEYITLNIDGHDITSQLALRYLGVMIDVRLNFRTNIEKACEKAARVNTALYRIMTKI